MPTFYKLIDIRFTQSLGWVIDCFLNKQSVLPISLAFDYHVLYTPGFCFNTKRAEVKNLFETRLAEQYNNLWRTS